MKKHKNGFTLAEVLITLMIIGIISAMTIPSIIQNTNKQELYAKFKKNYSVIKNALELAQVQEGMIGDNRAVFVSSDGDKGSLAYDAAKRFSKYLNAVKVCKDKNDTDCGDAYYGIQHASSASTNGIFNSNASAIILADGTIYRIFQYESPCTTEDDPCGDIGVDVNGAKKPNKFGEDNFTITVYRNRLDFNDEEKNGYGSKEEHNKILLNRK